MTDGPVRQIIRERFRANRSLRDSSLLLEEIGVLHGLGRVDMLVIGDLLHGIEIKAEGDTLTRLPDQIRIFGSVMDMMTLFVAFRHADKALRLVPSWWGVNLVDADTMGSVAVYPARSPSINPDVDPLALTKLLWRQEVLDLMNQLKKTSIRIPHTLNRQALYEMAAEFATLPQIQQHVRSCLSRRMSKRSALEQKSGDG